MTKLVQVVLIFLLLLSTLASSEDKHCPVFGKDSFSTVCQVSHYSNKDDMLHMARVSCTLTQQMVGSGFWKDCTDDSNSSKLVSSGPDFPSERMTTRNLFGEGSARMHKNPKDTSESKILYQYERHHVDRRRPYAQGGIERKPRKPGRSVPRRVSHSTGGSKQTHCYAPNANSSEAFSPTLVFVGVHRGALLRQALSCGNLFIAHGFEIQDRLVRAVNKENLGRNVWVHRIGMSNTTKYMSVSGTGEVAGLYSQEEMSKFWKNITRRPFLSTEKKEVFVTSLSKWSQEHNVSRVSYVSIDSEGHEVKVILGMQLEKEENRRKFPMFQFELGGTWAPGDPRRAPNEWDETQVFYYLTALNYSLLIIGKDDYVLIDSLLFPQVWKEYHKQQNLQGNLLAINTEYAEKALVDLVQKRLPSKQAWVDPMLVMQTAPNISLVWETLPINHNNK